MYIASRWKYLNHHKWFERLWAALQQEEVPSTILKTLDRDWTASALAAEKKCQSYPAGPYSQEIAKLRRKNTVFSHLISSKRKGISFLLELNPSIRGSKALHLLYEPAGNRCKCGDRDTP
jgi:hypothetical protein